MSATAQLCEHCKTRPVKQWVQGLLGTKTVELSRCDCDRAFCPHKGCGASLVDVPMFAHRCPACRGPLEMRRKI